MVFSTKRFIILILAGFIGMSCHLAKEPTTMESFKLSDVTLLDGPFKDAQQISLKYILALDVDRLLAPFLKDAGFEPENDNYGNWENTGLDGHIGGHYLSSLSMMYTATGEDELMERLNYMIDWLKKCQEKNGNGYVGGIPGGQEMWKEIEQGEIRAGSFSLNGKWVPLYNIHKLFAGLRDAYLFAGNETALDILKGLAHWFMKVNSGLTDQQIQQMLTSEHGGINEVFADLYHITGDTIYLEFGERFSHREILNPLIDHRNELTGKHANTQIPKVIGYKRIADEKGIEEWSSAANYFWEQVTGLWTVSIGGNSVREHFNPADDFTSMIESRQGPETCNTYNMLKLSRLLFLSDPKQEYLDYYERAMFNHILSSQHNVKGGYVYFTPMRPQHYRVYSTPQNCFWCCVGSGLENHAKYGEMIYTKSGDRLFVNMFIASRLNWKEQGLILTQNTRFPYSEDTEMIINVEEPKMMEILVRYPSWMEEGTLSVTVNGKVKSPKPDESGYISLKRKWKNDDIISVSFKARTAIERLPDGSNWVSFIHGPVVLGAVTDTNNLDGLFADGSRMGHVARGKLYPLDDAPTLVLNEDEELLSLLKQDMDNPVNFTLKGLQNVTSGSLKLKPFYEIHSARYMVYWPVFSRKEYQNKIEEIARKEKYQLELEKHTIDQISPGEQQPESDHLVEFSNSRTGVNNDLHWRDASGWFSYKLKNPGNRRCSLRITYYGQDSQRNFYIKINGVTIADVALKGNKGDSFFEEDYPVSDEILNKAGKKPLTLRFEAKEGSVAGGIYGIRLLKVE